MEQNRVEEVVAGCGHVVALSNAGLCKDCGAYVCGDRFGLADGCCAESHDLCGACARAKASEPVTVQRIKVITSHAGHARFLAECDGADGADIIGYIPRRTDIPSPYAYSATWAVYRWNGRNVIVRETSHKRYEVFAVTGPVSQEDN
jgi:hypothetical protein